MAASTSRGVRRLACAGWPTPRSAAIGLLGSTGAYFYPVARAERRRAIEAAVDEAGGALPVMAGVGALRTDEAVALAKDAKAAGAAAGLLAPVSYPPLTDEEVFIHVQAARRANPACRSASTTTQQSPISPSAPN